MFKRLLILARDFNQAAHWARNNKLSPGQYVYVSSYHNIRGNAMSEYVMLAGWDQRVDADILRQALEENACTKRAEPMSPLAKLTQTSA